MRIINGTGGGTGGTVNFTTAFASQAVSGTVSGGAVAATTLSTCQIPSHSHSVYVYNNGGPNTVASSQSGAVSYAPVSTTTAGGGSSHTHTFTQPSFSGSAINLAVKYIDNIMAIKS
jgi:microcystin-dependent protein